MLVEWVCILSTFWPIRCLKGRVPIRKSAPWSKRKTSVALAWFQSVLRGPDARGHVGTTILPHVFCALPEDAGANLDTGTADQLCVSLTHSHTFNFIPLYHSIIVLSSLSISHLSSACNNYLCRIKNYKRRKIGMNNCE